MKKFSKRLLSVVLSVLIVMTVMPATFASASEAVAAVDGVSYKTLAEAVNAAEGKTVVLLSDVTLNDTITLAKNVTIDGNDFKVVPANADNTYNSAFMAGDSGWGDNHGETINLNNIVFEGWKANYGVIRAQGVTLNIDGCEFVNCTVDNASYSILSSNYSNTTVTDTKFVENNGRVIDVNYNADSSETVVTVDGCTFDKNTSGNIAIIHRNAGTLVLKNSVFTNNTVNLSSNGATVYVGWGTGDEVTGCTFENNTVTTPNTTTKRLASAVFCGECTVTENVFGAGNTLVRNGEVAPTVVAVGAYYGGADISANYWNGEKPVEGENYLVEFGKYEVVVDTYYKDAAKTNLASTSEEEGPYLINTAEDLVAFRDSVNAGNNYAGKTVILNSDIDLSSVGNWTPIGDTTYNNKYAPVDDSIIFKGTFDGNGKVVSNLTIEKYLNGGADADANLGLFGITGEGAVIKDLTLTNVSITTDGRNVGALAGVAYKTVLENITVNGDIQISGGNNVSGVCAMTRYYDMSATNITVSGNDGSVIKGNNIVAGIFAEIAPNGSTQTFENLSVENVAINGVGGVGGIVGLLTLGSVSDVSVKNVNLVGKTTWKENEGRIRLGSVAGLLGSNYATISNATVENVSAKNLEGEDVILPVIGANYGADSNATEARIGDVYYATLVKAVANAKDGDTITLLNNVEQVDGIKITDKKLTLDLAGYTFKVTQGSSTNSRNLLINGSSVVTIKNGTLVAGGNINSGTYGTIRTEGTAQVTLSDLELYNYRGNGLNIKALSGTTVSISDTEVYSQYGGGIESAGGYIELTNVKVDQKGLWSAPYNSMAISVNGGGTVVVNSGSYVTEPLAAEDANNQGSSHGSWAAGVLNSGGTLIIKGGTFKNGNFGDDSLAAYARGLILADTGADIQIEDGTFNGLKGIVDIQNNLGDASKNPKCTITGGKYTSDVTKFCPDGFKASDDDEDGIYEIVIDFTAPVLSFDTEARVLTLTKNDVASARVGVSYIGDATFKVGVDNWNELVLLGKAYPNANGASGYVVYSDFTERSFKTEGNYVAFVKYTNVEGETVSDYYVFTIEEAKEVETPYFTVEGNKVTLVNDDNLTIKNVGAAYIGDKVFDGAVMGWNEFEEFGKAYTNYNGVAGYATYGASFTGKTFQAAGNYAGFVKYLDTYGNTHFAYYGFSIASGKTEYTLTYDETTRKFTMITDAENFTYRMGVAYIGDQEFDATAGDWNDFVAKGKAVASNGGLGYVLYVNSCPAKKYNTPGNYAAFVKYVDAYGNTVVDYYVFNIPKFNAPKLSFAENTLTLDKGSADSARVGVAFIGKQKFDASTMAWDEFVQMGKEYTNLNGSTGYVMNNNFTSKRYGTAGNYVAFVKYADNYGATKADYMTFTVTK